ncbi:flagellar hook-associated protein FlgL [Leeia sp. TBRC 13508]|uniref:Flagellar hook-associated protein FlgL n=1 Tax=Leeia speluncae TaxID=2884804 RepID=A0ABS8D9H8_9NEIS|nr:flagellar hook-associated protein FlgL [Leeia speluncae]MCB6184772.1 flagellar hook-associated protein FlgL [Leeia speluncae]
MRLSSLTIRSMAQAGMTEKMNEQVKAQLQLSTGKRVVTASDDPVAAARALNVINSQSRVDQFTKNGQTAADTMSLLETQLTNASDILTNLQDIAVQAGNGTLSDANKQQLAASVESQFREYLSLANTQGADGLYMFSGYQGGTQPFTETASTGAIGTISYNGDQGVRQIQLTESRYIQTSEAGDSVFGDSFGSIKQLYDALMAGSSSSTYTADVTSALAGIKSAQQQIGVKVSAVGTRQNEIDMSTQVNEDLSLQYETERSHLIDVDYAESVTNYMQAQQLLEVTRTTYKQTQGLSLFDYLS